MASTTFYGEDENKKENKKPRTLSYIRHDGIAFCKDEAVDVALTLVSPSLCEKGKRMQREDNRTPSRHDQTDIRRRNTVSILNFL